MTPSEEPKRGWLTVNQCSELLWLISKQQQNSARMARILREVIYAATREENLAQKKKVAR